jgi:hypothetical protein
MVPQTNGEWLGVFRYDDSYSEGLVGQSVSFRIIIHEQSADEFTGECFDLNGTGAIPEAAAIRGFTDGNFISFIKQYPYHRIINKEGELKLDKSHPHPEIAYSGFYDEQSEKWIGNWEMQIELGRAGWDWDDYFFSGTWEMARPTSELPLPDAGTQ